MDERYSIEVNDDAVVIWGDLSIEETFDFLNFFDKKGYKSLTHGYENSTIYMRRKSIEQAEEAVRIAEHVNTEKFYENLYDESKERIKKLEKDILSLEQLIKDLMTDEKKKQARIQRENDELHRARQIQALSQDPVAIKAIQDFHGMDRISRPMTEEEKGGAFNQLLNLKKDYPDILPSVEQMIKDHKNDTST